MLIRNIAAVFIFLWLWTACTPLVEDTTTTPTGTTDSAVIQVTNHLQLDSGTISVYLFPSNATDVTAAVPVSRLDTVPGGFTSTFSIPAGTWKIGIASADSTRWSMECYDAANPDTLDQTEDTWPTVQVVKNTVYRIRIGTTEGNNQYWIYDLPVGNQCGT